MLFFIIILYVLFIIRYQILDIRFDIPLSLDIIYLLFIYIPVIYNYVYLFLYYINYDIILLYILFYYSLLL